MEIINQTTELTKKRKVLVIDDDLTVNQVIADYLKDYGFMVNQAYDGPSAIEKFNRERHDLVFLDYRMPEMDGMDVLKEIRNLDMNAFVIFMTGEGSEDVAVSAMKAGAVDYLTKPISFNSLAHLTGKLIKEHDILLENVKLKAFSEAHKNYIISITETLGEAVITTNPAGRIDFMNSTAIRLWGVTGSLVGQELGVLFHNVHRDIFTELNNALDEGLERYEVECLFKRLDNCTFPGFMTASRLNIDPYHDYIVVVVRDLSDIEEMRRRMINTEKLASLGKVVEGVAHEIRNSLTSLGGFSRRLSKVIQDSGEPKLYLDYIMDDVRRLENVIHEIEEYVNYTKIHKPQFVQIDIREVIAEAIQNTFATGTFQGIKYVVNAPAVLSNIQADRDFIVETFGNLFKNACEAMGQDGLLEINVGIDPEYMVVDVIDTGKGIPQDAIKEIFNPFFTTKQKGAGVGLTKVYMIMEEHGGYISVKSTLGKGTRMRVYLPRFLSQKKLMAQNC
jgi:nitrogen fixation/metabolism regulation signal transduction histidine kinase